MSRCGDIFAARKGRPSLGVAADADGLRFSAAAESARLETANDWRARLATFTIRLALPTWPERTSRTAVLT